MILEYYFDYFADARIIGWFGGNVPKNSGDRGGVITESDSACHFKSSFSELQINFSMQSSQTV